MASAIPSMGSLVKCFQSYTATWNVVYSFSSWTGYLTALAQWAQRNGLLFYKPFRHWENITDQKEVKERFCPARNTSPTSFLTEGVRTESDCGHANQTEPRETALTYCNEMETAGKSYQMESSVLSPLAGTAYYLTAYVVQHALKLVFLQLVTSSEIWQEEEFENLELKKENSPSHN